MSRPIRNLTRLIVGFCALLITGAGGAAFASVPPPDPTAAPVAQTLSAPTTSATASSGMALWVVLLIAAGAIALGVVLAEVRRVIGQHGRTSNPATA